jgi:hypothetical protein
MKCIVCRIEVSRSSDAAAEFTTWETELGKLKQEPTGRVAHLVCVNGEYYDENQLTIAEAIQEE